MVFAGFFCSGNTCRSAVVTSQITQVVDFVSETLFLEQGENMCMIQLSMRSARKDYISY